MPKPSATLELLIRAKADLAELNLVEKALDRIRDKAQAIGQEGIKARREALDRLADAAEYPNQLAKLTASPRHFAVRAWPSQSSTLTDNGPGDQTGDREIARLHWLIAAKEQLDEGYRTRKLLREQWLADAEQRIMDGRVVAAQNVAANLGHAFEGLYLLSGRRQREWFYLAKAAAIAQTIINTQEGIMKAYAQGGLWGHLGAAAVAAAGAVSVATIAAQSFARGGLVRGWSPHPRADNVPAWLTAGEFVHPVATVAYYGLGAMEAIRAREVPREVLGRFSSGYVPESRPAHAYAAGGLVGGLSPRAQSQPVQVTTINILDRSELLNVLASADGSTVLWNWMSSNAPRVRRLLMD